LRIVEEKRICKNTTMKVFAVKTHKIIPGKEAQMINVLDAYVPRLQEGSVVAVSSKIISICQRRYVRVDEEEKEKLITQEAEYYLLRDKNGFFLTIKHGVLIPSAGIDESNGNGYYILWPEHPQQTANEIREYLVKKHGLKNVGVIITDSKTTPLRWGVTGVAISHSGFQALRSYIGTQDIFGKEMQFTKTNVMDALAATAVLVMGEGKEQTPLAVIEDMPFVRFQRRNPAQEELDAIRIPFGGEDIYKTLLESVNWKKGKGAKESLMDIGKKFNEG
jgi:dihydrofolate synthase / folylpolyglutamate synthase